MKKILLCMAALLVLNAKSQPLLRVNKNWEDLTGNPVFNPILNQFGVQWSKSITNNAGELTTVGHTNVSGQGENVFLEKHDAVGNLVFSVNWNSSSTNNDYGIDLTEDGSGNIYVCGTTDNGGNTNYDILILKFSSTGTYISSTTFAGSAGKNDVATALTWHNSGVLYIVAANENTTSGYDYLLLKYTSGLSFIYSNTYDYAGLIEVPLGVQVSGSNVFVTGTSQNNSVNWDYATARFNATTGNYLSVARNSISSIGIDQPLAMVKDAIGNIYLTGKAFNTSNNYDIFTVKITSSFVVAWSQVLDANGLDDVGNTLSVDGNGDVIVGGFSTKTNNKTDLICVKYNGSNGSLIWQHTKTSEDPSGDAFIKGIALDNSTGNIYFVGGEKSSSGSKQVMVGRLDNNSGNSLWQKTIQNAGSDVLPSDIQYGSDGVYAISVLDSAAKKYLTTKYSEYAMDTSIIYSTNGSPVCKKRELIVRFEASALDSNFIDNKTGTGVSEFGKLQDFMKPAAYSQFMSAISETCFECDIKAVKVFPGLTTTYTSSVSRLGETIQIPDLWTTLLLEFPSYYPIQQAYNTIKNLDGIVAYSHPNFIATMPKAPTGSSTSANTGIDPDYIYQSSLHPTSSYPQNLFPNVGINVEEAWQVFPDAGYPRIKAGVFDMGLDWLHADFGFSIANPSASKVQGWDFLTNQNIKNIAYGGDTQSHGTAVAGIMGAIRNNTINIKGIAGGNDTLSPNPNTGVSLYGLKIFNSYPFSQALNYIADAIISSSQPNLSSIPYSYGLHLQNHSWGMTPNALSWYTDTNIVLLSEAVHIVNRRNVAFIASRGNAGVNIISYPGVVDDDWVIQVSGIAKDGNFATSGNCNYASNWGRNVDIAAPSQIGTIFSTVTNTFSSTGAANFDETSAAAPHVSGVVALLMSYMNDTLPSYNNLAPEDCEQIIQRSASAMPNGANLPNDSVGYGRLNAGKALRLVEKPCNKLWHFGTKNFPHTITKSLISIGDTVVFTERCHDLSFVFNYLKKGKYIVNTWQVNATVNHSLPTGDTIKAYWPRPSGSDVWDKVKNNTLQPRERDTIISCNSSQANLRGYIYQVFDKLTNNSLGWWPCDTSFSSPGINSLFEYSILTRSCTTTGFDENTKNGYAIGIYPNPGHNSQTLEIDSKKAGTINVDIYDVLGRYIKKVYSGKTNGGKTSIVSDIGALPNSLYIYIIKINDEVISKKFLKE